MNEVREQSFDPAAEFLLSMGWQNLFEQADDTGASFRCKGCRQLVPLGERQKHFNKHRGVRRRQETARLARIERERLANLEKARLARLAAAGAPDA